MMTHLSDISYIVRIMHMVSALLCFVVATFLMDFTHIL